MYTSQPKLQVHIYVLPLQSNYDANIYALPQIYYQYHVPFADPGVRRSIKYTFYEVHVPRLAGVYLYFCGFISFIFVLMVCYFFLSEYNNNYCRVGLLSVVTASYLNGFKKRAKF